MLVSVNVEIFHYMGMEAIFDTESNPAEENTLDCIRSVLRVMLELVRILLELVENSQNLCLA